MISNIKFPLDPNLRENRALILHFHHRGNLPTIHGKFSDVYSVCVELSRIQKTQVNDGWTLNLYRTVRDEIGIAYVSKQGWVLFQSNEFGAFEMKTSASLKFLRVYSIADIEDPYNLILDCHSQLLTMEKYGTCARKELYEHMVKWRDIEMTLDPKDPNYTIQAQYQPIVAPLKDKVVLPFGKGRYVSLRLIYMPEDTRVIVEGSKDLPVNKGDLLGIADIKVLISKHEEFVSILKTYEK